MYVYNKKIYIRIYICIHTHMKKQHEHYGQVNITLKGLLLFLFCSFQLVFFFFLFSFIVLFVFFSLLLIVFLPLFYVYFFYFLQDILEITKNFSSRKFSQEKEGIQKISPANVYNHMRKSRKIQVSLKQDITTLKRYRETRWKFVDIVRMKLLKFIK